MITSIKKNALILIFKMDVNVSFRDAIWGHWVVWSDTIHQTYVSILIMVECWVKTKIELRPSRLVSFSILGKKVLYQQWLYT